MIKFRKNGLSGVGSTHLSWAILLLVVAVVLPTVFLLWFVSQAMRNERLAVRQKFIDVYGGQVESLFVDYSETFPGIDKKLLTESASLSSDNLLEKFAYPLNSPFQGMAVYDKDGRLIYPVLSYVYIEDDIDNKKALEKAWQLEFVDKNFLGAAASYDQVADSGDDSLWAAARAGKIRCLKKADKLTEAAEACQKLAWPGEQRIDCDRLIANARLMQLELYRDMSNPDLPKVFEKILDSRFSDLAIDSPTKVFLLRQCISIAQASGISKQLADKIKNVERMISFEEISAAVAQNYSSTESFKDWPQGTFRSVSMDGKIYGIHTAADDRHLLGLVTDKTMSDFWSKPIADLNDQTVFCRIIDDTGRVVVGPPIKPTQREMSDGQRFLSREFGKSFPGWKVDIYFADTVFEAAARRQKIIYFWTLVLVIASMFAVSALLARSILQQAKLSKLKNNFIATVTHELKTPLSSMRLLVDTLLDGRVKDTRQSEEYLALVSKENERLSRLIDNFLTFSRMERNKQVFELTAENPGDIATAAANAVQAKFHKDNCKFDVTIDDGLPSIIADKDAMVTVLVNLLDNACKYSGSDKQIHMKVFKGNGSVCFSVKDNGIGMSRRVVKKIFNKFYQADTSLSRKTEGCGLGLSIVKFIVDAHKGTINVESELGKGTVFTVKLKCEGVRNE